MTQESQFAGHMINESTEIVFMDEWSSNSLSCEEAKRVLQGIKILMSNFLGVFFKFVIVIKHCTSGLRLA